MLLRRRPGLVVLYFILVCATHAAERLIAICGAYAPEMIALKAGFGATEVNGFTMSKVKGVEFWRGTYAGKEIVIFKTGMSLVNAAYQLQIAFDHFPITHVLFAGVAGGVDPSLDVGDVVIPDRWAYHGEAAYLNDDGKGGHVVPDYFKPRYKNFGMIYPEEVGGIGPDGIDYDHIPAFPIDPALLDVARKAILTLPKMEKAGRPIQVKVGGTGVAGSVFLDNAKYREWLFETWQARCVDMESTALAHVAHANGMPILIIRGLSDLAGGQHGPNPISDNEYSVSEISVQVLKAVLESM